MVNEVPLSLVECLEKAVSKHIRHWLGLPPSFSSVYGKSTKLQLPFTPLAEKYMVAKARLFLTVRDSAYEKIIRAGIEVCTGRKWSVSKAVQEAEGSLQHQVILGTTNCGREGLWMNRQPRWEKADTQERRSLMQQEVRRVDDTKRSERAVQMGQQGSWTRWKLPERRLSWQEPLKLPFLLRSAYDLLKMPTNLERWRLNDDPNCPLCRNKGTLPHILTACPTALSQGRYRWRQDQVLTLLADFLEKEKRKERQPKTKGQRYTIFVKEGQSASRNLTTSILHEANHWEMKADLQQKLVF